MVTAPLPPFGRDLAGIPVFTSAALPADGFWCHPDVLKGKLTPHTSWAFKSASVPFDPGDPLKPRHDAADLARRLVETFVDEPDRERAWEAIEKILCSASSRLTSETGKGEAR